MPISRGLPRHVSFRRCHKRANPAASLAKPIGRIRMLPSASIMRATCLALPMSMPQKSVSCFDMMIDLQTLPGGEPQSGPKPSPARSLIGDAQRPYEGPATSSLAAVRERPGRGNLFYEAEPQGDKRHRCPDWVTRNQMVLNAAASRLA